MAAAKHGSSRTRFETAPERGSVTGVEAVYKNIGSWSRWPRALLRHINQVVARYDDRHKPLIRCFVITPRRLWVLNIEDITASADQVAATSLLLLNRKEALSGS